MKSMAVNGEHVGICINRYIASITNVSRHCSNKCIYICNSARRDPTPVGTADTAAEVEVTGRVDIKSKAVEEDARDRRS